MANERKKYSQEFKDGAVHLVLTGGRTSAAVARELGLKDWQVRSWVRKAEGANSATTVGNQVDVAEFKRLKREHKRVFEILKCAQPCRTLSAGVLELVR
ncbi:MAG: transposase [Candidatus Obscuribacterales bacterium]|nr:transposase [Candidatus Obscuribacterales bacterium]